MDMEELLEEGMNHTFEGLGNMTPGTEEYSKTVEDLSKLYKLKLEERKIEVDRALKTDQCDAADRVEAEKLKSDKFGKWLKLGTDMAGIVLPLLFYGKWMGRGLEFEKNGTFTSKTFMGLINKFRPTK